MLDVRLPDGSGVEVCREIRSQDDGIKCLMLTSFADDEALFDAIMAGASGYVLKADPGQRTALRRPRRRGRQVTARSGGDRPGAGAAARRRGEGGRPAGDPDGTGAQHPRSDRRGHDQSSDRERLHLAEKTVKNYVSSLLPSSGWSAAPRRPPTWPECRRNGTEQLTPARTPAHNPADSLRLPPPADPVEREPRRRPALRALCVRLSGTPTPTGV